MDNERVYWRILLRGFEAVDLQCQNYQGVEPQVKVLCVNSQGIVQ